MDGSFDRAVLDRLPLAEAVLTCWRSLLNESLLNATYDRHRGRCHTRLLSFPDFVRLLFDGLTGPWKSGRASLVKARDEGRLPVSLPAFYDKMKNTPVDVSLAFFRDVVARLRAVAATHHPDCPASLQGFTTLLMDGKVVKHVCRRLKELRLCEVNACKLLGPRNLVVADRWSGLLVDLVADLDGEANEVKYVGALLRQVCTATSGPLLFVADRAFGVFKVCQQIRNANSHFLLRQHGTTVFVPDPEQPAVMTTDRFGRCVVQRWGWVTRGKPGPGQPRLAVRQITVQLKEEALVLLTSLCDATAYPVEDLLDAYLARWDIEGMFQKVTEVFQLRHLFSTQPQGMLFQLVLVFLMYDVVQVIKTVIAEEQGRAEAEISTTMLFRDITEELISVRRMLPVERVQELIAELPTPEAVRQRLRELLRPCWCNRWLKANYRPRDPSRPRPPGPPKLRQAKAHDSVQRILNRSRK